jgi:CheY-like chemotaxis protein
MRAPERIKYFRERAGLRRNQLESMLELADGEVDGLESGEKVLELDMVPALVRALGVTYDDFFGTRRLAEDFQTEVLIQKISALPPAARRDVDQFVDFKIARAQFTRPGHGARARTVLIVDDDTQVRQTLVQALQDLTSHRVFHAANAEAALRILENSKVDLLVTDLVMPKVSGVDLIARVRLLNADLPIIALTGYVDILEMNDALDVDVVRAKPLSLQGLIDDIQRIFETTDDDDPEF